LSMVGLYTVVGNQVSASEVYPTITSTQTVETKNSNKLKDWLSNTLFKFIDLVKSNISQNSSNSSFDFILTDENNIKSDLQVDEFSDISTDSNRYYINYLSENNIISNNSQKFYPQNFVRLHELSKILVNSYRHKVWYKVDWNIWLSDKNYFDKLMPKYYNTAYEMWILNWIENLEDFERFISYDDLEKILKNLKDQYPELINLYYFDLDSWNINIRRWELTKVLFKVFMMGLDNSDFVYQDTFYHKNSEAINELSNLGITNQFSDRFYPDEDITRGDFIMILVRSYLKSKNLELTASNIEFNIKDLDYNSDYAPYVVYAQEQGMIDYLFEIIRSENYINLNKKLSKHEAYFIVSNINEVEITYDVLKADKENITRWEIAQLIVDSFDFNNNTHFNWSPNSQIEKFVMNVKSIANSPRIARLIN